MDLDRNSNDNSHQKGHEHLTVARSGALVGDETTAWETPPMQLKSVGELLRQEFPPERWLVEGLIPTGSATIFVGDGGTNKSWFAQALTASLAAGRDFLGAFPIKRRGRVLYIQTESSERGLQQRFRMIASGMGLAEDDLDGWIEFLDRSSPYTEPFQLERGLEVLEPQLRWSKDREQPFDLVVIDPLADFHSGDENSVKEMKPVADGIRWLRDQYGVAFLILHHTNKNPNYTDGSSRSRGSTALINWMDGRWFFKKARKADVHSIMDQLYLKEHGPGVRFRFIPDFAEDVVTFRRTPLEDEEASDEAKEYGRQLFLEAVAELGAPTYKELAKPTTPFKMGATRNYAQELADEDIITIFEVKRGKTWTHVCMLAADVPEGTFLDRHEE